MMCNGCGGGAAVPASSPPNCFGCFDGLTRRRSVRGGKRLLSFAVLFFGCKLLLSPLYVLLLFITHVLSPRPQRQPRFCSRQGRPRLAAHGSRIAAAGVPARLIRVPGGQHGPNFLFLGPRANDSRRPDDLGEARKWFDQYLKATPQLNKPHLSERPRGFLARPNTTRCTGRPLVRS
jgi:hypothetical protein